MTPTMLRLHRQYERTYLLRRSYVLVLSCRWLLLESVVGTLVDAPTNPYDLNTVDFTFQVAANNSQTTARVFAHGINSTMALQPTQGRH